MPDKVEEDNARMTTEQLKELSEALSILSAKSSVLKERNELRVLMDENLSAEEVEINSANILTVLMFGRFTQDPKSPSGALTKRIRSMLTKIDSQIQEYDSRVGNSLQMISADPQGRISVKDFTKALAVIKHKLDDDVGQAVVQKLDVDKDGFVELEHVLGLVREEGLGELSSPCRSHLIYYLHSGVVIDDEAQLIIGQGTELKNSRASKPRKEDIVQE
jgi:LETM1 and EF-hand domain-containing protein 1